MQLNEQVEVAAGASFSTASRTKLCVFRLDKEVQMSDSSTNCPVEVTIDFNRP